MENDPKRAIFSFLFLNRLFGLSSLRSQHTEDRDTCLTQFCLYVVEPWNYSWKGGRGLILLTLYMNGTIGQIKKTKTNNKTMQISNHSLFVFCFFESNKMPGCTWWVNEFMYKLPENEAAHNHVSGQSLRSAGDTWTLERHNFGLFGLDFLDRNIHILMVCTHVVGQPGECHSVGWRERWKMLQDTSELSHIFTWLNRRNLF